MSEIFTYRLMLLLLQDFMAKHQRLMVLFELAFLSVVIVNRLFEVGLFSLIEQLIIYLRQVISSFLILFILSN